MYQRLAVFFISPKGQPRLHRSVLQQSCQGLAQVRPPPPLFAAAHLVPQFRASAWTFSRSIWSVPALNNKASLLKVPSTTGGGGAGTGPFTLTATAPPPPLCWVLAGKCRTMGAEFCLT